MTVLYTLYTCIHWRYHPLHFLCRCLNLKGIPLFQILNSDKCNNQFLSAVFKIKLHNVLFIFSSTSMNFRSGKEFLYFNGLCPPVNNRTF